MSDIGRDGWPTADAILRSERKELAAAEAENQRLRKALTELLRAYDMVFPGIKYIAVQDYQLINEAPIAARRALEVKP